MQRGIELQLYGKCSRKSVPICKVFNCMKYTFLVRMVLFLYKMVQLYVYYTYFWCYDYMACAE